MGDLADLAGVPERQLRRIIRLTASVGFLQETKPNYVSHTPMSAQFLSPSLSDAALFITSTYTPSALQMADATKAVTTGTHGDTGRDVALHRQSQRSFRAACQDQERCKLGRQWKAYLDHAAGSPSDTELVDTFSRLNWSSLGSACIVEASTGNLFFRADQAFSKLSPGAFTRLGPTSVPVHVRTANLKPFSATCLGWRPVDLDGPGSCPSLS